jgi:protein-S-isoprenylcysteine O-methyltransferase Ste14
VTDVGGVDDVPRIGWGRAILTAVVITVVGTLGLVVATQQIVTRHGVGRSTLVGVATTVFFVGILLLAWALRRLQARGLI